MVTAGAAIWRVRVDTGGTFTDCLAFDPEGRTHRAKVLSSSALRGTIDAIENRTAFRVRDDWNAPPDFVRGFVFAALGVGGAGALVKSYDPGAGRIRLASEVPGVAPGIAFEVRSPEAAPVLAARLVTRTAFHDALPPLEMRLATTRGTNALLERRGAPTALFITDGFGDLLRIGTQQRPDLFALDVRRPPPLYERVVEVAGRLAADGAELRPLDLEEVAREAKLALAAGLEVAAIALAHAYRNPAHELAVEAVLRRAGFTHISRSSRLAPAIRLLPRAETAVVDAYLAPVVGDYLRGVEAGVGRGPLVMTSAGGLVRADGYRAKDSLLSGPAGGVVGAARAGARSGLRRVIAFDMGGTSTDVARYDGRYEYVWEHVVGGAHLLAPALAIESVAAGGGSVCSLGVDGLRVGPESAGADPGPACYGAGGPFTVTDANVVLGRLDPRRFGIPIRIDAARAALAALRAEVEEREGRALEEESLAEGLLAIANERMADAIRGISLRLGYDPADYALVAFGGAGAQHACGVAERLGMRTVVVPRDAGLLSALGLDEAVIERFSERQVLLPLDSLGTRLAQLLAELRRDAARAVADEGVAPEDVVVRRRIARLRYSGQDAALEVELEPGAALGAAELRSRFERRYAEVYGHRAEGRAIEVESVRVVASSVEREPAVAAEPEPHEPECGDRARVWLGGRWVDLPVHDRERLRPGARISGAAIVRERHSSTLVETAWSARVDGNGALRLEWRGDAVASGGVIEAVEEELFVSRFRSLVSEMGDQLRRTAISTNVKERLDFSCALLDRDGSLVVNAPHIPVHLGALGLCVRAVRAALPVRPGDVVVTNHPAFGGSHLPDVTVVSAVFDDAGEPIGYLANRAHHAEIGGTRPGSMPPRARSLGEEGVVIEPAYLIERGAPRWDALRQRLAAGPFPSRAVEDNLADLRAQVAANQRGTALLRALVREHGRDLVTRHMRALKDRAERGTRAALSALPARRYSAIEYLDDGTPLRVSIEVDGDRAIVDFAGSGAVHPGNLNATPAIVRSAVLYVLRLLVREPLPLNEGLLEAVEVRIPEGMLNPPFPADPARAPAVVGGNTEVSQRIVDTLIKALGLAACSQGTMNNVLWGTPTFGYYETVCGGTGAGAGWAGAAAVHSHMTNTRITDPEVVEHRYPVRIERFGVRRGSGGEGRWRGGDGAVRETVFLAPLSLSVLTQHRREGPCGSDGGAPGAPGRQVVLRADGSVLELGSVDGCEVGEGDRLILETPGGGGWGTP